MLGCWKVLSRRVHAGPSVPGIAVANADSEGLTGTRQRAEAALEGAGPGHQGQRRAVSLNLELALEARPGVWERRKR